MRRKLILSGIIAVLTVGFVMMLPGMVEDAYRQGAGSFLGWGLTLSAAERAGVVYAALFILGSFVPVFGIVILLLFYAFSIGSARRIVSFSTALILCGIAFHALAAVQLGEETSIAIAGSTLLWVAIGVVFCLLVALIATTKRLWPRREPDQDSHTDPTRQPTPRMTRDTRNVVLRILFKTIASLAWLFVMFLLIDYFDNLIDYFDNQGVAGDVTAWIILVIACGPLAYLWGPARLRAPLRDWARSRAPRWDRVATWLSREWRLLPFYIAAVLVSLAALRYIFSEPAE